MKYNFIKRDIIINGNGECYYPSFVDYREYHSFPFDWAIYTSTDHGSGGISLYVANGDPRNQNNWMSYKTARRLGYFDGIKDAPKDNPIYKNPEGNGDSETPCVNIVNGKVYLTFHNSGFKKANGDNLQLTLLATSDNGVVFKPHDNGSGSAVILNADGDDELHTGYFRWGKNPFKYDYEYIGYSVKRGGAQPCMCIWGSDDAIHWEEITHLHHNKYSCGFPDGKQLNLSTIDLGSVQRLNEDLFYALCDVSDGSNGLTQASRDIYGVYLNKDGYTIDKLCELEIARGPDGNPDESEVCISNTFKYGNKYLTVYQNKNRELKNTISIAETNNYVFFESTGRNRYPYIRKNTFIDNVYDFNIYSELPDFLTDYSDRGGSIQLTEEGIMTSGTSGASWSWINIGDKIIPSNYEFIEIIIEGIYSKESVRTTELFKLGFTYDGLQDLFVHAWPGNYYEIEGVIKKDYSDPYIIDVKQNHGTQRKWFNGINNTVGIRWYPIKRLCEIITHGNTVGAQFKTEPTDIIDIPYQPYFAIKGAKSCYIKKLKFRSDLVWFN